MRRVLIVVDMQNDFVDEKGVLSSEAAREILPFVQEKVQSALAAGEEVVFTLDSHEEDDAEFAKFPPHCLEGTWGHELVPELQRLLTNDTADQVHFVKKNRYSGFYRTDLAQYLGLTADTDRERVSEVSLVGVCTNICCFFTAEELANRDVPTTVYAEGMASFDKDAHAFALSQMKTVLGAEVI
ncbi:MAG: cysteine hydrolase family protein [bacterium]